ncbi:MAG: hypothetical protein PHI27_06480 [Eubacteriales bacterium]|nr:hypothetical protein [Eubacteriales bacterium]MDD3881881.1 hypothetical protein [Eubacteriales bacterium]MDD4512873.1 hypothetical protein [Eubacteriales bacterium]
MLTSAALQAIRTFLKNSIAYARYKVAGSYYNASIEDATILADGRISVSFIIDHTIAGNITVTEVQLFDHNGVLWASKAESITRLDAQEGILYRFRFTVSEP